VPEAWLSRSLVRGTGAILAIPLTPHLEHLSRFRAALNLAGMGNIVARSAALARVVCWHAVQRIIASAPCRP
jgi:hypothetical protein